MQHSVRYIVMFAAAVCVVCSIFVSSAAVLLRDRQDAEDEVQNACWKAFEHIGQFQRDAKFSTWLHRIAVSVALISMTFSLLLAVAVNRLLRSGRIYTTLLVWPYAVAPAVAQEGQATAPPETDAAAMPEPTPQPTVTPIVRRFRDMGFRIMATMGTAAAICAFARWGL